MSFAINRDTQTDRVLIAEEFYYFGNNAITIPARFNELIGRGRNHKVCKNEILINDFIDYMRASYDESIYGTPYSRKEGKFAHYKGEQ